MGADLQRHVTVRQVAHREGHQGRRRPAGLQAFDQAAQLLEARRGLVAGVRRDSRPGVVGVLPGEELVAAIHRALRVKADRQRRLHGPAPGHGDVRAVLDPGRVEGTGPVDGQVRQEGRLPVFLVPQERVALLLHLLAGHGLVVRGVTVGVDGSNLVRGGRDDRVLHMQRAGVVPGEGEGERRGVGPLGPGRLGRRRTGHERRGRGALLRTQGRYHERTGDHGHDEARRAG